MHYKKKNNKKKKKKKKNPNSQIAKQPNQKLKSLCQQQSQPKYVTNVGSTEPINMEAAFPGQPKKVISQLFKQESDIVYSAISF